MTARKLIKAYKNGQRDFTGLDLSRKNLSRVDLTNANLMGTNLMGTNLMGTNLENANLQRSKINYCIGNKREIKNLNMDTYPLVLCGDQLAIGCEQHSVAEWFNFSDDEIDRMDRGTSLYWWEKNKNFIKFWIEKVGKKCKH